MRSKRAIVRRLNTFSRWLNTKSLLSFSCAVFVATLLILSPVGRATDLPTYTVVAKEGRLIPEVLNVPAGVRFKIVVRNEGRGPIEFESTDLIKEKVLPEGVQSFLVIAPLRPGEYLFFDEFHPDTGRCRLVVK